jgi:4-hydroxythreonine-4-phosphate dehydrogenase
MTKPVIAVTIGDPAGIGPEIVLKSLMSRHVWERGVPLIVGDLSVLKAVRDRLGLKIRLNRVRDAESAFGDVREFPVFDVARINDPSKLDVGAISELGGEASVAYIRASVDLCKRGGVAGIATAPINKEALRAARFHYIGHTEMLAEMSEAEKSYTVFIVDKLRILFHSRHISLRKAIETLDEDEIVRSLESADRCLRSIGMTPKSIALAALNPHASDGGLFGDEENRILIPAVARARQKGLAVTGPVPADSVFALALQGRYDIVVSLFHDQGHIAAKTYDFYKTVSITFGLPFLRTSVDHGTAYDIAWKGLANPVSMETAILSCYDLAPKYRWK